MKRLSWFVLLLFVAVVVLFTFLFFSYELDDEAISNRLLNLRKVGEANVGLDKSKKILKDIQSYYNLPTIKVFTKSSDAKSVYIRLDMALAYPYEDHKAEKEIIQRRGQISSLIERKVSAKTYRQLNTVAKKEELKTELLNEINKFMKNAISDIYYIEFMTLPYN